MNDRVIRMERSTYGAFHIEDLEVAKRAGRTAYGESSEDDVLAFSCRQHPHEGTHVMAPMPTTGRLLLVCAKCKEPFLELQLARRAPKQGGGGG